METATEVLTWERRPHPNPVVKPMMLTHGTAESYDLKESRRFYEEFLGLSCVRIAPEGLIFALGVRFYVVVLALGQAPRPQSMANHWGVQVGTKEEVDQAYQKSVELKDKYGIREIVQPVEQSWGTYSFMFQDLDHNWWEVEYYPPGELIDDYFAFGDVV